MATHRFCEHILANHCDFYVLNLQEAQYNIIEQTLKAKLGTTYEVLKCSSMDTVTNINSLGQNGLGIANIIIYDKSKFTHQIDSLDETRRFKSISDQHSEIKGYNKGGVSSIITLQSIEEPHESIKLQMISGHLDANSPAKRAKDWQNIQEMASVVLTEASTWYDLVSMLPNLRISGMDCNTRDLISSPASSIWTLNHEEIQGFNQFPFGNLRFSSTDTYVPKSKLEEKEARYHSQGYTLSGSLDVNEILNYQPSDFKNLDIESSLSLDPDENHPRDHKIIITPTLEVPKLNEFQHVQLHLHILLKNASPILADQLLQLTDTPESRQTILDTFRLLIAKEGLLFKIQNLYQHKLEFINEMKALKKSPLVIDEYKQLLFSPIPWLYNIQLDNMAEKIAELRVKIQKEFEFLDNPPVPRSLDELKQDCRDILSRYKSEKNFSFSTYFSSTSKQSIKKVAIQALSESIMHSHSIEQISNALTAVKSNSELFVRSGEEGRIGLLAQLIQDAEQLIQHSDVLIFEGEECLPNLKKWLINKLDSYSTLPKDNSLANAASINNKIKACHELIKIVHDSTSIDDIFRDINIYKTSHREDLFKKTSGKFSTIVDDCIEMTARYMKAGPSSQLRK